jgi:prepilin-type N-terminal cleavage/methylation domain-containing protein
MKTLHKGFTLVELMVTLAVAMILITVGIPSMTSMYENSRAQGALENIESAFLLARSQAVSYGSRVTVCPMRGTKCDGNWTDGFSVFLDNGLLGTIDATAGIQDTVILVVDKFHAKDFIKSDFNSLSFTPDGLAQRADNGRFIYCPGSKTNDAARAVDVGLSGRMQRIDASVNCN